MHQIVLSPNERQSLLHKEGMCGIGAIIPCNGCSEERRKQLSEAVVQGIRNRGPDSLERVRIDDNAMELVASVLHMRGREVTVQPLISKTGDVLLWNGEVFCGIPVEDGMNDTEVVLQELEREADVMRVMQRVRGPFAFLFYRCSEKKLYFGRDPIGRRSLLIHFDEESGSVLISSAFATIQPKALKDFNVLSCDEEVKRILFEDENNCGYFDTKDLPPSGIFSLSRSMALAYTPYPSSSFPFHLTDGDVELARASASVTFLALLKESVWTRVRALDSDQSHVCVLFSGGIDCSLLAALLCAVLEEHGRSTTVELANVSFTDDVERLECEKGPALETLLPDRFTALMSFAELLSLYPRQRFAFLEVNVTNEEMMEKEAAILACVSPSCSQMDFQIGCCYWFLSRGEGRAMVVEAGEHERVREVIVRHLRGEATEPMELPFRVYELRARVVLSGIGADELCGGYTRYQAAYEKGGEKCCEKNEKNETHNPHSLHDGFLAAWKEMNRDWSRLWYRNLGRDDRCISEHGREMRSPFLDEQVSAFIRSQPVNAIVDYSLPRGEGDKLVLRRIAKHLGFVFPATLSKRAIQFGSRIVKQYNSFMKKSTRKSKGSDVYVPMTSAL